MTLDEAIKPVSTHFVDTDQNTYTWAQVKKMLYGSNESYFDAQDFIDMVEDKLE